MSFNLIKADLQLDATEPHEIELQKLMLSENLRGLIECVSAKDDFASSDIDVKIKALVSDVGKLQKVTASGFYTFMQRVL